MKVWDKLDETLGAGMLVIVALVAMIQGYDGGTAQMCITGVVALLTAKVVRDRAGGGGGSVAVEA